MSKDYMKAFARLMDATFLRYKGVLIEVYPDGFKWGGQLYPTKEEVYAAIDGAFPELEKSINRIKQ